MLNSKVKDQINALASRGYCEVSRFISENQLEKAKSLAYAFSLVVPRGEDGNYDWSSALLPLNHHHQNHPATGLDVDFLSAFDALRKNA